MAEAITISAISAAASAVSAGTSVGSALASFHNGDFSVKFIMEVENHTEALLETFEKLSDLSVADPRVGDG